MKLPSSSEEQGSEEEDVNMSGGLAFFITPKMIRMLCENAWDGGRGYTPREVGDMTLDQILMCMADKKVLRDSRGRKSLVNPSAVTGLAKTKDGLVKGRAADGTPIVGRVGGKSKLQMMKEARLIAAKKFRRSEKRRRKRKGRSDGN